MVHDTFRLWCALGNAVKLARTATTGAGSRPPKLEFPPTEGRPPVERPDDIAEWSKDEVTPPGPFELQPKDLSIADGTPTLVEGWWWDGVEMMAVLDHRQTREGAVSTSRVTFEGEWC